MGTGAHAIVAICAKRMCPSAHVTATDLVPQRVDLAREAARRNRVAVDFRVGNLFASVPQRFDLVLFCPPVIPSDDLLNMGYPWQELPGLGRRRCWSSDGGADGLQVIGPFLRDLRAHLSPAGQALVAANPAHCPPSIIESLCRSADLRILRVHRLLGIVNTYAIGAAPPGGAEGRTP
jgi:release factor glutamine methyltransferase